MAARIERVEREFIIFTAAEGKTVARIQAQGRTIACAMESADRSLVRFTPKDGEAAVFKTWEKVSVYFDFRGQAFVFESTIRKSGHQSLEIAYPESMYRGMSRKWPRVRPPRDLSLDLILPDGGLDLSCPVSREYTEVDLPESRGGLKADSLGHLIESFKAKAEELTDENHVIMFKEGRGPQDLGEQIVSNYGRALFIPSVLSGLPLVDPYPEGRVITKARLEDFTDDFGLSSSARLGAFLDEKGLSGMEAALWCPVRYYRYTIGVVYLAKNRDSKRPFDFRMLDFAWDFSRLLAWFLKSYGYFDGGKPESAPRRGAIVDASPTGILVGLGAGQPRFKAGSRINLLLGIGASRHACIGRVVRHFEEDGRSYYGLVMENLDPAAMTLLSQGLYGAEAALVGGQGG